jgi:hypothetical protein
MTIKIHLFNYIHDMILLNQQRQYWKRWDERKCTDAPRHIRLLDIKNEFFSSWLTPWQKATLTVLFFLLLLSISTFNKWSFGHSNNKKNCIYVRANITNNQLAARLQLFWQNKQTLVLFEFFKKKTHTYSGCQLKG